MVSEYYSYSDTPGRQWDAGRQTVTYCMLRVVGLGRRPQCLFYSQVVPRRGDDTCPFHDAPGNIMPQASVRYSLKPTPAVIAKIFLLDTKTEQQGWTQKFCDLFLYIHCDGSTIISS